MAPLVPVIGQRQAEVQAGRSADGAAARVRVAESGAELRKK
jgi:hypothetical protein